MKFRYGFLIAISIILIGCGKEKSAEDAIVRVNDYAVTPSEFEDGFTQSPFALREDRDAARQEYLNTLINQKVIIQDAIMKDLDKKADFLRSIEKFWEQALLTVAVGEKTREIAGALNVSDDAVRTLYDQMVRDGVTEKTYIAMYPQIKWQAAHQMEAQRLKEWIKSLREKADIRIDQDYFIKTK